MNEPIPVVMYHSVAPLIENWAFSFLSIEPAVFEDQISTFYRAGYTTIFLRDLFAYVSGKRSLPRKAMVLTFDDGYLDNWVFAYPILKKYGFRGTIFVSTDFIDGRGKTRPTIEDVWSRRLGLESLSYAGFLSVPEMQAMIQSGLIEVQGHCKTHTWYFTDPQIVDFHRPGDAYPWLGWNARPERKSLYLEEDQSEYVPFGSPVYAHDKSLVARRYFPDDAVQDRLARLVETNGGRRFFEDRDWKLRLSAEAQRIGSSMSGRHEDDRSRLGRLREEIVESKQVLERMVDRPVDFLCWPGGGYDQQCVSIAREAGFKAWTLASREASAKINVPGENPEWIRRLSAAPWWYYRGRKISNVDGRFMKLIIDDYKSISFAGVRLKWYKLGKLLSSYIR